MRSLDHRIYLHFDRVRRAGDPLPVLEALAQRLHDHAIDDDIAKYFSNSLREDGLLAIAKHGVIYAPGSAGTIQEVFMDAAQNHYGTFQAVSPMVVDEVVEFIVGHPPVAYRG